MLMGLCVHLSIEILLDKYCKSYVSMFFFLSHFFFFLRFSQTGAKWFKHRPLHSQLTKHEKLAKRKKCILKFHSTIKVFNILFENEIPKPVAQ